MNIEEREVEDECIEEEAESDTSTLFSRFQKKSTDLFDAITREIHHYSTSITSYGWWSV